MSPHEALHSPVFLAYLSILIGVLVVAGVVLAFFSVVLKKEIGSVWRTYRSWLIMAPLIASVTFAGSLL